MICERLLKEREEKVREEYEETMTSKLAGLYNPKYEQKNSSQLVLLVHTLVRGCK